MRYWTAILLALLLANSAHADSFNLTWDAVTTDSAGAPIQALDGYKLYVSTSPIKATWPSSIIPIVVTTNSKTITYDTVGKYYAVVSAYNASGESLPSNEVLFEVQLKAPGAPTNLKLFP